MHIASERVEHTHTYGRGRPCPVQASNVRVMTDSNQHLTRQTAQQVNETPVHT